MCLIFISVMDPDPPWSAFLWLPWIRIRIGMQIRIQKHGNWPKFTNSAFKRLLYLRMYVCFLGGFNVSNLMGIKRRAIDIGKKIIFYFLQNVWKCAVFFAFYLKFEKSAIRTQKYLFREKSLRTIMDIFFLVDGLMTGSISCPGRWTGASRSGTRCRTVASPPFSRRTTGTRSAQSPSPGMGSTSSPPAR